MAEEKNIENNSGLGATGNFIHSYICISVMQNPSA